MPDNLHNSDYFDPSKFLKEHNLSAGVGEWEDIEPAKTDSWATSMRRFAGLWTPRERQLMKLQTDAIDVLKHNWTQGTTVDPNALVPGAPGQQAPGIAPIQSSVQPTPMAIHTTPPLASNPDMYMPAPGFNQPAPPSIVPGNLDAGADLSTRSMPPGANLIPDMFKQIDNQDTNLLAKYGQGDAPPNFNLANPTTTPPTPVFPLGSRVPTSLAFSHIMPPKQPMLSVEEQDRIPGFTPAEGVPRGPLPAQAVYHTMTEEGRQSRSEAHDARVTARSTKLAEALASDRWDRMKLTLENKLELKQMGIDAADERLNSREGRLALSMKLMQENADRSERRFNMSQDKQIDAQIQTAHKNASDAAGITVMRMNPTTGQPEMNREALLGAKPKDIAKYADYLGIYGRGIREKRGRDEIKRIIVEMADYTQVPISKANEDWLKGKAGRGAALGVAPDAAGKPSAEDADAISKAKSFLNMK